MRQMMEGVVLHGTGTDAPAAGIHRRRQNRLGADFRRAAQHYTHTYNGSFMGFAPLTNPSDRGGGDAERHARQRRLRRLRPPRRCFKVVATEALRVLDVPKDIPDESHASRP